MELSDDLLTVFSGEIKKHGDTYMVDIPERELNLGDVREDEVYRIAILPNQKNGPQRNVSQSHRPPERDDPPVEVGEVLDVEIEDMGDQGDGIARVGPGYVVIVSDTNVGDRVTVEITEAKENVAFAEIVDRKDSLR